MVEQNQNQVRDTNQRPRPTGGRLQTREATEDEIKLRDEVAAAADKAAVADVAGETAGADMTARGVTRVPMETTGAKSLATSAARRATSSPSAQRRAKCERHCVLTLNCTTLKHNSFALTQTLAKAHLTKSPIKK